MAIWKVFMNDGSIEYYNADFVEYRDERIEFRDKSKSFFKRKSILKSYVPKVILKYFTVADWEGA